MRSFLLNPIQHDLRCTHHMVAGVRTYFIFLCLALALSFGLTFASTASAAVVSYNAVSLGGTQWRYDYRVVAEIGDPTIVEFTTFFESGSYANLAVISAPAGWDALAISPDSGIPADGFFDALSLVDGISSGSSLGGFSVSFTFLGDGKPSDQRFDIVDPMTFATIDTGTTTVFDEPVPVPEPSALSIFILASLLALRRHIRM